uniref:Mannose-6-phosphate isomerase n=1 Tax=Peronospora matthiolae TaxID=2874970 RepID=A0AAV1TNZ9_9STRA
MRKLRPRQTLFFKRGHDVTHSDVGEFLQPASRNYELVDAMAKPDELFQVTCAQVHPCEQNGLLKALEMLGNPDEPRLYFVVPPDVYEGFEYQEYHTVKGGKGKIIDKRLKKLEQHVIKIDFSHKIRLTTRNALSRSSSCQKDEEISGQSGAPKCAKSGSS